VGIEDVTRDLEERRARGPVEALTERHRHHVGGTCRVRHRGRELRDRGHDVDVREVLQGPHLVLVQRALAADEEHRALRAQGVGHARDRVAGARAGSDHGAAGLAGDARVAVGGVRGHLLVTNVDDIYALIDTAVVDVDNVAAAECVDRVHALCLERLRDQVAAGDRLGCDRRIAHPVPLAAHGDRLRHGDAPPRRRRHRGSG
jgi:hypothetical protein